MKSLLALTLYKTPLLTELLLFLFKQTFITIQFWTYKTFNKRIVGKRGVGDLFKQK